MHGREPERHCVRETLSLLVWGLGWPVILILLAAGISPWWLFLFASYPILSLRIARGMQARGFANRDARLYGAFCVLGKFPGVVGVLRFAWSRLRGRRAGLIEYRSEGSA